ncbi:hypothetical protein QVD17_36272 [Tagetes erecta]|uniref:Uncharacterized protein n=1 Tax=Tagetes erecta TaxID=13708 RepID=A0AAD8NIZ0_TARER|nr:hypothetical protein QVD17_36272 [Tagetes erecta]
MEKISEKGFTYTSSRYEFERSYAKLNQFSEEFSSSNSDLSIWADVIVWSNKAEDFKIKRRVLHQERRSIVLLLFRFASFVFLLIRDCRFLLLCLVSKL